MVVIGIDAHKRNHTAVAVDDVGRQLATRTVAATTAAHLDLLRWAKELAEERVWAVEDCRHLSPFGTGPARRWGTDRAGATQVDDRQPPLGSHLWQVRPDRRVGRGPCRPTRA